MSVKLNKYATALVSGCCAAMTSFIAKLALGDHLVSDDLTPFNLAVRALLIVCALLFNGLMWTLFVEADISTNETVVLSTAANIFLTSFIGLVVFSERVTITWLVGAGLILLGMKTIMSTKSDNKTD